METDRFYYELPRELIAQSPAEPRDSSRLLILNRNSGDIRHARFSDISRLFGAGDVLVMNDTKVLPARLSGKKMTGGRVELLILNAVGDHEAMLRADLPISENSWHCYVKGKRIREGMRFNLDGGPYEATIEEHLEGGKYRVGFSIAGRCGPDTVKLDDLLGDLGSMPTPPYIKKNLEDPAEYQTVYARNPGSVAAPTAGLHFSRDLLVRLREKGVIISRLTLHLGPATVRPVSSENVEGHVMDLEHYYVDGGCARTINEAMRAGGRLWVVGTTTMKTLETVYSRRGSLVEDSGNSDLYIYPPYRFRTPSSFFLTNFHLPRSTLLMMISAYAGMDAVKNAYDVAVRERYRFYSFGDAMLIEG